MVEVECPPWLRALPVAPEFRPTEAEFADPVAYILKVEEEAKQYGICKIIPPFAKASKKVVTNNLNHSLSMSSGTLAGSVNRSCGVAPFSRSMGGATMGPQLTKPKGMFLDASCGDSAGRAKFATRRQQLGWNPKRARGAAHSQNHKLVWQSGESYTLEQFEAKAKLFSRSRLGTCKDVSPLSAESLFWRAAADRPISVEYANDIPASAFAEPADSPSFALFRSKKRKRAFEEAEQGNPDGVLLGYRIDEKLQEEEEGQVTSEEFDPSDALKSKIGGLEAGGDNAGGVGSKLANSAWNMRNVARSQGSLLRFMPEEVPGVTSPMVYIGMLFSWFAWHVEDHELHSLNYLHMGASKTWYAVPGDAAPALEEAIRVHGYGGYLNPKAAFSLLGEKTTVMSPEVLVAAGVPCCRIVQNAGEYVVTFPRAYHLGFSHGFNCGEAANFATPGWLEVAKEAAARRAAMNYLPMLSHQQLLYLLTMSLPPRMPASDPSEPRSSRLKVRKRSLGEEMVKGKFLHDIVQNNRLLCTLLDNGVSRCILAKDTGQRNSKISIFEGSGHNAPGSPPLGATEMTGQASATEMFSRDICHLQSQPTHLPEDKVDCLGSQPFRASSPLGALPAGTLEDVPKENCGEGQGFSPSDDTSVRFDIRLSDQRTHAHDKSTSLVVDWGILPCAACGILCYSTMAVVEPSGTAAMTFKQIYAAAGLEHCVFEADDSGRTTACLPAVGNPSPAAHFEANVDDKLGRTPVNTTGNRQDEERGMSAHFAASELGRPVVHKAEATGRTMPLEDGCLSQQVFSEEVKGTTKTSPATHFASKQEAPHFGGSPNVVSQTDTKSGFVNMSQSFSLDSRDLYCQMERDKDLNQAKEELQVRLLLENDPNIDLNFLRSEGQKISAEACNQQERQRSPWSADEPRKTSGSGVSSLQLLASNYDESSDFDDEDIIQATNECIEVVEDEETVDNEADGSEVIARPHYGVGDLLTDIVGVSSDVPWLSLLPRVDALDPQTPVSASPLFVYSSLVEGPKSLQNVFVSGGFSFVEEYGADQVGPSSLTEELSRSKSGEAASFGGDPAGNGRVTDMQDFYQQINSKALTLDSDEDEQFLIHFGLRPPRASMSDEFLDLHESENTSIEPLTSVHALNPNSNSQIATNLPVESGAFTNLGSTVGNPSVSSMPGSVGVAVNSTLPHSEPSLTGLGVSMPFTDNSQFWKLAGHSDSGSVTRWNEIKSLEGRVGKSPNEGGAPLPVANDTKETGLAQMPERKQTARRACNSVARPRVLCLEHAVEAQKQLRAVGGANVVIVCHADFENYELRAKELSEDFDIEHTWRHIPFSSAADDEISMVSTAVDVEDDDGRRVNDWVMQMGLFVHHHFKERESESSDDGQSLIDDFRAGPFNRVKVGRPAKSRLMTASFGLPHKADGHSSSYSGVGARESRTKSMTSKKKKCTVAGRWCGRVWRLNQVHPFLGGSRKVDPSLQLGMSSTSLYALSVMSDCDGGKYRKGISSSRVEAAPSGFLIPVKNAEDQQGFVVRRGRKRKVLAQVARLQPDNGSLGQRRMAAMSALCSRSAVAFPGGVLESVDCSSSPQHGTRTESVNGAECRDLTVNSSEGGFLAADDEGRPTTRVCPQTGHQAGSDVAVEIANSDLCVPGVHEMLNPLPLASRQPPDAGNKTDHQNADNKEPIEDLGVRDLYQSTTELGGHACCELTDRIAAGLSSSLLAESEAQQAADVKPVEFPMVPLVPPVSSARAERRLSLNEDGGWRKTASLTNVYSTLPFGGVVTSSNGNTDCLAASYNPIDGNRTSDTCSASSCVWRDVPVASAPSLKRITSPLLGQFGTQFSNSFPNTDHLYIPCAGVVAREVVTDRALESQTSHAFFSGPSFTGIEQKGEQVGGAHLLQGLEVGTLEGDGDPGSPDDSSKCATTKSVLYSELLGASAQHPEASGLVGVKRKRDRQAKLLSFAANSMEIGPPSLSENVADSCPVMNSENDREGSFQVCDNLGTTFEGLLGDKGILQVNLLDVKNVVKLSDCKGLPTSELGGELVAPANQRNISMNQNIHQSEPLNVHGPFNQSCNDLEKNLAIEVTPRLRLPASLMESPRVGNIRSGELGYFDGSQQAGVIDHILPLPSSNRGRSAVKARGKRPKHVGWTNHKQAVAEIPGEGAVKTWALQPHSNTNCQSIYTLRAEECVEARFEADDSQMGLAGPPAGVIPCLGTGGWAADSKPKEEITEVQEVVAKKSKKKSNSKKKMPTRKAAHEEGEFQCDIDGCRMGFATEGELQIHKRNRCTFKGCGKRFFMHKYLLQHRRVHLDERPLKCPWKGCKQSFKWAWARTEHIRVHTGERPYTCPDCDQTFRFVSDFSRHKRNTGHTKS